MGSSYTRFKVTYRLRYPYLNLYELSCFDAIIGAKVSEYLGTIDRDEINQNIPLRKIPYNSLYFHAASIPLMEKRYCTTQTFTQSTDAKRFGETLSLKEMIRVKDIIQSRNGPWKQKVFKIDFAYTDEVSFVVDVENEEIDTFKVLAEGINYLGKKRHWGYGMVRDVLITETDEKIIRPVPVDSGYQCRSPFAYLTVTPPYWGGRRYLCGMTEI